MSGVIFKQSYKSRSHETTPGLNVRHLQYIATRPGAVYNRGCGFGLWGKLPGDDTCMTQTDLEHAKAVVREHSQHHTLYRAIISVKGSDAQEKGLYARKEWERLLNQHIYDIAKQMDMLPEDLAWCASFHCAKDHPHIHILYWDTSDQPKPESIAPAEFEKRAEKIRAAFSKTLYREEIHSSQSVQRDQSKELRRIMKSLCQEANPAEAYDLARLLKKPELKSIGDQLQQLLAALPSTGSLKYAYLPAAYKSKVNSLIDLCLEDPKLKSFHEQYLHSTKEISRLYGNGSSSTEAALKKAEAKLQTDLGNEILSAVKQLQADLLYNSSKSDSLSHSQLAKEVTQLASQLSSYHSLQDLMPRERIPTSRMPSQIPGWQHQLNDTVNEILSSGTVRPMVQGHCLARAGIDLDELPFPSAAKGEETETIMFGRVFTAAQKASYAVAHSDFIKALRSEITQQVRSDAGWNEEHRRYAAAMVLQHMLRAISQVTRQRQEQVLYAQKNNRSKDQSRESKKDHRIQRGQSEHLWTNEIP